MLIDKKYLDKDYIGRLCIGVVRFSFTDKTINCNLLHLSKMMSCIMDDNLNIIEIFTQFFEAENPIFLKVLGNLIKIKLSDPSITDDCIKQKLINEFENKVDNNTFSRACVFINAVFVNSKSNSISNIVLDLEFDKMFKYILLNRSLQSLSTLRNSFYEKEDSIKIYDGVISNVFKNYENSIVSKDITIDGNVESIDNALSSVESMNQEVRAVALFEHIKFLEKKRVAIAVGVSGCLAGSSLIRIKRGNRKAGRVYTIKDAYHRITHTQRDDAKNIYWNKEIVNYTISHIGNGRLAYNEITAIYYSGKKITYTVITDKGNILRCTNEHPFLTPDYNFVELKDLKVGDEILGKCTLNSKKGRSKNKKRVVIETLKYYPYGNHKKINGYIYQRVNYARLLIEAQINNLNIDNFINILKTDKETSENLKFLSPNKVVHHKDFNCLNDEINNLIVLDKIEHDKLHGENSIFNIETHNTWIEKIVSIIEYGIEDTYDISMKKPHSNYVANNLVVHNTGKSMFLCHCIAEYSCKPKDTNKTSILFYFTFENSREETFIRIMSNVIEVTIDDIKFNLDDPIKKNAMIQKYLSLKDPNTVLKIIELPPKKHSMAMVEAEIKKELVRYPNAEVYAVALDYIDKMLPVDTTNKTKRFDQMLGDVVDDFKSLTRMFECAGLSVSQVNRFGAKKGKNESWDMTDIGGSWEKIENADIILLMEVENLYEEMGYNVITFRNPKHRYYADGSVIPALMRPQFAKFYPAPANILEMQHVDNNSCVEHNNNPQKQIVNKTNLFR